MQICQNRITDSASMRAKKTRVLLKPELPKSGSYCIHALLFVITTQAH